MDISKEEIQKLAHLSHLSLTDEEVERFQAQVGVLLQTADKLNELETSNVPETFQVSGAEYHLRPDEANYTFEKSDVTATMPRTDERGNLIVPAVFTDRGKKGSADTKNETQVETKD